jgi:hypothetical protein
MQDDYISGYTSHLIQSRRQLVEAGEHGAYTSKKFLFSGISIAMFVSFSDRYIGNLKATFAHIVLTKVVKADT